MLASVDRWGDYPTWLAAIGTILAVVVALGLAGRESRQRRHEDERRQAELITAWLETVGDMTTAGLVMPAVAIVNGSQQLAYRVIASLVPVRGAITENFREVSGAGSWEFRAFKGELPLGRTNLEIKQPGGGMHIRFAVELAFRDAAGRSGTQLGTDGAGRAQADPWRAP